ncbi:hypothetical protein [Kitasatospora sp. NRRL B-11411]|uniref:hypothetical protein n=1 Tax=Kitasatospora sp. NRRL B-11411 TaxID=1463822 RepID=UPI0004C3DE32|nr:hypothetical protein [Kitasatospora sp. NRRL B-11411]
MNRLDELWAAGRMPLRDGLFRADGRSREAAVEGADLEHFRLGGPIGLDGAGEAGTGDEPDEPDELDELDEPVPADIHVEAELPGGAGRVVGGGGSHGSEGFLARLGADGSVVWLMHLGRSNEFVRIAVDWPLATFTNNCGRSLTLDLASSDFSG